MSKDHKPQFNATTCKLVMNVIALQLTHIPACLIISLSLAECHFVGEKLCPDAKTCVLHEWWCDGHYDCPGGGDETNCGRFVVVGAPML